MTCIMKVLMLDAGPGPTSNTAVALEEIRRQLEQEGVEPEILCIGDDPTQGGVDRAVRTMADMAEETDGYVFACQGHFGVANSCLATVLHRFFNTGAVCVNKPVSAVITCRRSGGTSALAELNSFFTMKGMPLVSSTYWNVLVGSTPEMVKQDAEGLKTMRNLARNMAWMLKSIEAGKADGLEKPALE